MDPHKDADSRVTRSQTLDLPQPSTMADANSPGLSSPVASWNTRSYVGRCRNSEGRSTQIDKRTNLSSRIMPLREYGSDGQTSNSGFLLPVEQVLAMQQQKYADLKHIFLKLSRQFQIPTATTPPYPSNNPKSQVRNPKNRRHCQKRRSP